MKTPYSEAVRSNLAHAYPLHRGGVSAQVGNRINVVAQRVGLGKTVGASLGIRKCYREKRQLLVTVDPFACESG
jgi:hypothetical protein